METSWMRVASLDEVDWPEHAVLICDDRVREAAPEPLRAGMIAVKAGESLKTLAALEKLAEQVLERRATRPLTIVAMGGGSVGDAVGFLASILWRGVDLWHVPTTLLAAVDSAHGGKTAVNLGSAKNQLGTFWSASRTIFAESFLHTMPVELRAAGLTELIKGLWLGDAQMLEVVDRVSMAELCYAPYPEVARPLGELLDAAVAVKQDIVARDPRETRGIRTWLNLGHTVAHGLELICGMSHGVAVAWGLASAACISADRALIDETTRNRLWEHVFPLLGGVPPHPDRSHFIEVVGRDKKSIGGRLRSVLLLGPGSPMVVDDVSAEDWFAALAQVRSELFDASVEVRLEHPRPATLTMSASKSELNRALVIAALRNAEVNFSVDSTAEDVQAMRAGIASLRAGLIADAKNGGTTFRFLSAYAACLPDGGRIRVGDQLARRPHEPLFAALRASGVAVTQHGNEFHIGPLPPGPVRFEVDASTSSQFASALLLIEASGREVELAISGELASPGYFEMTRRMLDMPSLEVSPDASSAAMWHVLEALGMEVSLLGEASDMQPDTLIGQLLWDSETSEPQQIDIAGCPDLAPVLAAYAALTPAAVTLCGAPHLAHKESDRIDDLVAAFGGVGVVVEGRSDGLFIAHGRQRPRANAWFDPHGDHRLAFAAIILSTAAPLRLETPRCVTKSYPDVFSDAQQLGFVVKPTLNGSCGRSPDI